MDRWLSDLVDQYFGGGDGRPKVMPGRQQLMQPTPMPTAQPTPGADGMGFQQVSDVMARSGMQPVDPHSDEARQALLAMGIQPMATPTPTPAAGQGGMQRAYQAALRALRMGQAQPTPTPQPTPYNL